jgi:hypothetical protein
MSREGLSLADVGGKLWHLNIIFSALTLLIQLGNKFFD